MGLIVNPDAGGKLAIVILLSTLAGCQNSELSSKLAQQQQLVRSEQTNNIASLSEAIKSNPKDANALNLRGAAYGQAGEYQKALEDFNAALAINPQYAQAYSNRALIYVRSKRIPQAISDYDQAITIDPTYSVAYVGRGSAHRSMNNHPMAVADFTRALELQADPIAYFNRGLSRQALGQHAEAIDDFDNALGFRPDAPEVYHAKGLSELELRKYEKAFDDFYKAAQGSKNNYEAWALRGRAAEGMGAKKEAAKAYQRSLQINPSFRPAREGLDRVGNEA